MASRRMVVALAGVLAGAALAIVPATSASAATTFCTTRVVHANSILVPANGTSTSCELESGRTGTGVSALQDALHFCYHQSITVDGDFGPATKAALVNVQKNSLHITGDGIYGPITHSKMLFFSTENVNTCFHD